MKRIVICGASGFLATHVIEAALRTGMLDVLAVVSDGTTVEAGVDKVGLVEFLESGCSLSSDDILVNCLFPTNANGTWMADGLDKVFRITMAAKSYGVGAYVNISSQSVYDPQRKESASEASMLCLESPYAVGKFASEQFCQYVFAGQPHTSIRLASLIGAGYGQRIVNRLFDFALCDGKVTVVGGMQRYGFLDVRDAARGIVALCLSDSSAWEETYNLGREESVSLLEIAELVVSLVKRHTGRPVQLVVKEGQDRRNSSINPMRFINAFHWEPEHSFVDTAEEILLDKLLVDQGTRS